MTHIDDVYKEQEMLSIAKKADSIVCMSEHNAEIMWSLGGSPRKIIGNNLPHRGGTVRRPRVGIFSARYSDGRKNEGWLINYFKKIPVSHRHKIIICLIGYDWESFGEELARLGVSFEIYRYDRSLPGEYELQKDIVAKLDKLLYLGFDGGSMSVYDGMHANVEMIVSDQCYHRNLSKGMRLFSNEDEFVDLLDDVIFEVAAREEAMEARSIVAYTTKLLMHWNGLVYPETSKVILENPQIESEEYVNQLKVFRNNYRRPKLSDALRSAHRFVKRLVK
jgi:hypothetical protein